MKPHLPYIIAFVLIAAGATLLYRAPAPSIPPSPLANVPAPAPTNDVTLAVEGVLAETQLTVRASTTVLELLTTLDGTEDMLKLQTENHDELGTLVVSLGEHTNGEDDRYWHYYVNDELPMIGANQYVLQEGDHIEWRFEKSQF